LEHDNSLLYGLCDHNYGENETYRGLMAKIQQSVNRFVGDEDPKVRLCEEFFLKALSPAQAQWIRRM
jgi:hypothetical protein